MCKKHVLSHTSHVNCASLREIFNLTWNFSVISYKLKMSMFIKFHCTQFIYIKFNPPQLKSQGGKSYANLTQIRF